MANSYYESSSFLTVPKEKLQEAETIIKRIEAELENGDEGVCECSATIKGDGVWFRGQETINVEHVAEIAGALIEELEIDEPFFCSWAYTCDKPRIDEFGGGAFVIKRGYETYWCDARSQVEQQLETGGMIPQQVE